jgi:hypothetical protein
MKIKNKTKGVIKMIAIILIFAISLVTVLTLLHTAPVLPKTIADPVNVTDTSSPLVESYKEANTHDLAILISNRDFSTKDIEKVLQSHGYKSYEDGCEKIASTGKLVYVPQFETNGITYGGYYTTKSTILYHTALEAGIIKE